MIELNVDRMRAVMRALFGARARVSDVLGITARAGCLELHRMGSLGRLSEMRISLELPDTGGPPPLVAPMTVSAQRVADALRGGNGTLAMTVASIGELRLSLGAREAKILASEAELPEPMAPLACDVVSYTLDAETLREMVQRVAYAAHEECTRYAMNCVAFWAESTGGLTIVATDGKRLATARTGRGKLENSGGFGRLGALVPTRAALAFVALAPKGANVKVWHWSGRVMLDCGSLRIDAPRVEGEYPPWTEVVKQRDDIGATCSVRALENALKRVRLRFDARSYWAAVRFSFEQESGELSGELKLSSKLPEVGAASDTVAIEKDGPLDLVIGFDPRFVLDMLGALDGSRVTMRLGTRLEAMRVYETRSEAEYTHLIMPLDLPA